MVIAVELNEKATGYAIAAVSRVGTVNDSVGGEPIVVVVDPGDTNTWSVFSRRVEDRVLKFEFEDGLLVDTATGTRWDPLHGTALAGSFRGEKLITLPAFTIFPEKFHNFFPEGDLRQ